MKLAVGAETRTALGALAVVAAIVWLCFLGHQSGKMTYKWHLERARCHLSGGTVAGDYCVNLRQGKMIALRYAGV